MSDTDAPPLEAFADPLAYNPALRVAIHVLRATGGYQKEPTDRSLPIPKVDPVADVRACAAHIVMEFLSKYV